MNLNETLHYTDKKQKLDDAVKVLESISQLIEMIGE